jgi:Protein of unknown function (DUF1549)
MPKGGEPLTEEEAAALAQWIKGGLAWASAAAGIAENHPIKRPTFTDAQKSHWAFQPLRSVKLPQADDSHWPQNGIDDLTLAAMKQQGLAPSVPADKRTLLRRVTFNLTGLPPTPNEIASFLADESPKAFANVVDRLLESPHYGERVGRLWLDQVRYADNPNTDSGPQGMAWPYRDWVVRAFNEDLPYDRFVVLQIAGDLLRAAVHAVISRESLSGSTQLVRSGATH